MKLALLGPLLVCVGLVLQAEPDGSDDAVIESLRQHWNRQLDQLRRGYIRFRATSKAITLDPEEITPYAEYWFWWDYPRWRVKRKLDVPAAEFQVRETAVDKEGPVLFVPGTGTAWLLRPEDYPSTGVSYFTLLSLPVDPRDQALAREGRNPFWLPFCLDATSYRIRRQEDYLILERENHDRIVVDPARGNAVIERWAYFSFRPAPDGLEQLVHVKAERHVQWEDDLWVPKRGTVRIYPPAVQWQEAEQARPESVHTIELIEWSTAPPAAELAIALPAGTKVIDQREGVEYVLGEHGERLEESLMRAQDLQRARRGIVWNWLVVGLALVTVFSTLAYVFWMRRRA